MAVINITVTDSDEEIIDGIPRFVTISTNVPSIIFYTLDSSTPTNSSLVYSESILLPTTHSSVTLKILATNGIDSGTYEKTYTSSTFVGARLPHAATTNLNNNFYLENRPYSLNTAPNPNFQYRNNAEAGITVDAPNVINQNPGGYDGYGGRVGPTDLPLESYKFVYSTTNSIGEEKYGVGTLPAKVKITANQYPQEYRQEFSSKNDLLFNPKATVIYQDVSKENINDPPMINRGLFSLENSEIVRDGNNYFNSGIDSPTATGSFVKSFFNPRTNELSYYYYDNKVNRWIISKTPFDPKAEGALTDLSKMVVSGNGAGVVFKWLPFRGRKIF